MSTQHNHPSPAEIAELEAWAEAGDFHDVDLTGAVTGDAALAAGRALMEAAGVDVDAVAHSRVGRPSLTSSATMGKHSPMWHVRAPEALNEAARKRAEAQGRELSALVREAVDLYLRQAG